MLKHAKILVTTLVLSLMVGLMPTGSVLAAESEVTDDVIMLDDATENAGDDGDTIEPEEHYWVRYAWDETSHLLICKCGVEDCSKAGGGSRGAHTFDKWWVIKEPTVDEEGLRNCSCWCGYTQEEVIPKLVIHSWERYAWDETSHWLVCACGVENCPEAGSDSRGTHDFSEWSVIEEATTEKDGLKNRSCWCGYTQNEVIPKIETEKPEETEKPDENPGGTTKPDGTEKPEEKPGDIGKPDENPDEATKPGETEEPGDSGNQGTGDSTKPEEKPGETTKPDDGTSGSGSNNNGGDSTQPSTPGAIRPVWPVQPIRPIRPTYPEWIERPLRPIEPLKPLKPVKPQKPQILKPVKVYQITITNAPKTLKVGKKVRLKVRCDMANVKNKKVTWKSSNCKYATVNKNGVVKAKKAGKGKTVRITAIAKGYTSKNTLIRVKVVVKIKIK